MKTRPFPYPGGLEQLEGLELTATERLVAYNPSFQVLRNSGFPKWGELTTGLKFRDDSNHDRFNPVGNPLSPSAATKEAVAFGKHLIGVVRLSAKIRGNYVGDMELTGYPEDHYTDYDARLIHDFTHWLDHGNVRFKGFRWEEHWANRQRWWDYRHWDAELLRFRSSGETSDVVVLLAGQLSHDQQKQLYKELVASCIATKQLPPDTPRKQLIRHLPMTFCEECNWRRWHTRDGIYPGPPVHSRSIPLVDCTDPKDARSWVKSSSIRRKVKVAGFTISHGDFTGYESNGLVFAQLLVFDLVGLTGASRKMVSSRLEDWIEQNRLEEIETNIENDEAHPDAPQWITWGVTRVLRPNSGPMNCLLVAGPAIGGQSGFEDAFRQGELHRLLEEGMSVTVTHAAH